MRIAISADTALGLDAAVSPHFGRCPFYTLADIQDGRIETVRSVANPHCQDHVPGVVPQFVSDQGAHVVLTGGMGQRAVAFFKDLGVQPVTGASGTVHEALAAYLEGSLVGAAPCHESAHDCGDGPGHGSP